MPTGQYQRKPCSEETKKKISFSNKGKKISDKTRRLLSVSHSGKTISQETKEKMSNSRKRYIKEHPEEKEKLRIIGIGRKMTEAQKKQISNKKTGVKIVFSESWRNKQRQRIGNKAGGWKGGITPENKKIRTSFKYKLWRTTVFKRDNYTCIWCGKKSGINKKVILNADHIKPFSLYPELRFDINNGRTLCIDCHKETPTFGYKLQKQINSLKAEVKKLKNAK